MVRGRSIRSSCWLLCLHYRHSYLLWESCKLEYFIKAYIEAFVPLLFYTCSSLGFIWFLASLTRNRQTGCLNSSSKTYPGVRELTPGRVRCVVWHSRLSPCHFYTKIRTLPVFHFVYCLSTLPSRSPVCTWSVNCCLFFKSPSPRSYTQLKIKRKVPFYLKTLKDFSFCAVSSSFSYSFFFPLSLYSVPSYHLPVMMYKLCSLCSVTKNIFCHSHLQRQQSTFTFPCLWLLVAVLGKWESAILDLFTKGHLFYLDFSF